MPLDLRRSLIGCALAFVSTAATADPAPFDLAGPTLEMEVTRGEVTLPAARVPSLAPGDRLWLKADMPAQQSAHYLMVAVFLRGATNPPPSNWFVRCDTWEGKCAKDGMTLTVPKEAQQLLVFLAPETGGDFKTLVDAVRGRPGAFVRTSQDLNQATLDHSRLERYLAAIRALAASDPARLKDAAPLLARSLAIKVDEKCLDKMALLQASCLMQGRESMILNDGHSASLAQTLTSGPASDLAMEASSTAQLRSGYYGPFIGSIFDIARILDSFHTAQYQYIPALSSARERQLALTLNAPPSFHDPKSVLVLALPAVENPQLPPLQAVDPKEVICARKDPLVLQVEGAPLVFSTGFAHGMTLKLTTTEGKSFELPATADAERGGFLIETAALRHATLGTGGRGSLQGYWGFDAYQGPSFEIAESSVPSWELVPGDASGLIVGRQDTIHIHAADAHCVAAVALRDAAGKESKLEWKSLQSDQLEIKIPLQDVPPGELTLLVSQYGNSEPQRLALHAYAEASRLETFTVHAGDDQGILRGTRLDEVDALEVQGVEFSPGTLSTTDGRDELAMVARPTHALAQFRQGDAARARVSLKDGRTLEVKVSVEAARPSAGLIDKSARNANPGGGVEIHLSGADELPQDAQLTFSLRAQVPPKFSRQEKIEVATEDGTATVLDATSGAVTFQNARIAIVTLDPAKALGSSAFGPLRFRIISEGVAGDWHALATLVRLPLLKALECPESLDKPCVLTGLNLFLLDSVSGDAGFSQSMRVPDGFPGGALQVPHPTSGQLYLKLRDDPKVISVAVLKGSASPPPQNVSDSSQAAPARPVNAVSAAAPHQDPES
jgi:hypothetical protein